MKNEFILQPFKTAFCYTGHLRGNKAILFITPQPCLWLIVILVMEELDLRLLVQLE